MNPKRLFFLLERNLSNTKLPSKWNHSSRGEFIIDCMVWHPCACEVAIGRMASNSRRKEVNNHKKSMFIIAWRLVIVVVVVAVVVVGLAWSGK